MPDIIRLEPSLRKDDQMHPNKTTGLLRICRFDIEGLGIRVKGSTGFRT